MQDYQPYHIHHIDLDQQGPLIVPASNSFVVFWSGAIPLGHLWIDKTNMPLTGARYEEMIETAIRPAKAYYEQHPAAIMQMTSNQKLSVIICTSNRTSNLQRCIHALLNNSDKDFELIVIDNAPRDSLTKTLVQKLKYIKYIPELRKGLDIARNTGVRAASHPFIAFTDDDVIVSRDWIRNIKNSFSEPSVMAITGIVFPRSLQTIAQYTFERYWGFNKGYLPRTFDREYFNQNLSIGVQVSEIGAGANMAFRKEVFDWVGGFDERLDAGSAGCSGDSELWYRILANGWKCKYFPSIYVFHSHRESPAALSRQLGLYMRGQSASLLVQYEKFQQKGNIVRLKKLIPEYYVRRFGNRFIKRKESRGNLYTELRGFIAGWFYYHFRRKATGYGLPFFMPYQLHKPVVVKPDDLVSVIIPCYNASAYLEQAIQSALNQSYQQVEVIVVDDGSTEDIESVCRRFPERVKYIRIGRSGISIARNTGVCYSHGSFLVFLDADDYLYPDALSQNLDWFRKYPDAVFISGGHNRVDDSANLLPTEKQEEKKADNYRSLLRGNYIAMEATVMYRRTVFPAFHFDPVLRACEDYDLNLRICRYFEVYGHTGKIAAYRIHLTNTSNDRKLMLGTALAVLDRQKPVLLSDAELRAWQEGKRNWMRYYSLHRNGTDQV